MVETTENKLIFQVGTERVYPFPIRFFSPGDIHCYININGVERELDSTEYSIAHKEDYSSGSNVTLLLDPLPLGATFAIIRRLPITQNLALPMNGKLPSSAMEKNFDRIVMICQQLLEEISRCISVDPTNRVSPSETLALLFKAQEVAAKQAERAETAANAAMVNGETQVQRAKHFADQAKESAAKAEIGYDELGGSAVITPDVAFSEDQIIYDEV